MWRKRVKVERAKVESRQSGSRQIGSRQTGTRQTERAKLAWHRLDIGEGALYWACFLVTATVTKQFAKSIFFALHFTEELVKKRWWPMKPVQEHSNSWKRKKNENKKMAQ